MKFILLLILLFSDYGCSQMNELIQVKYQAKTRGASKYITITPDRCSIDITGKISEVTISSKEWNRLKQLVEVIKLNEIQSLEVPSTENSTDRKMMATVLISINDTIYESTTFDDGNPPKELEELVNKIFELAEIKE